MALRKPDVIPKGLFVQFDGVSSLVWPKVAYSGKDVRELPVLARQDGFEQLYTPDIIPIYKELKATDDIYRSLAEKQPLVQANKLSEEAMVDILTVFGNDVLYRYDVIWVELLDWQPEKRIEGYELPRGKNAVLYRNWSFENEIDVSDATVIPVKWMEENGAVSREIVEQLNVPEDTDVWVNKRGAIENSNGLNALALGFQFRLSPDLYSSREPWDRLPLMGRLDSNGGALLGVRLSAEEMVENFNPE